MNKNLIITISIIVGIILLAILIYYFATKGGKLQKTTLEIEKAKQDIIQQKLENAPQSRIDLQTLIDEAKRDRSKFAARWISNPEMRRGARVSQLPESPIVGVGGKTPSSGWSYSWAELEQVIDYYNNLISGYEAQFNALL